MFREEKIFFLILHQSHFICMKMLLRQPSEKEDKLHASREQNPFENRHTQCTRDLLNYTDRTRCTREITAVWDYVASHFLPSPFIPMCDLSLAWASLLAASSSPGCQWDERLSGYDRQKNRSTLRFYASISRNRRRKWR